MGRSTAGLLAILAVVAWAPGPSPARALEDLKAAPAPPRTPEFVAKVNKSIEAGLAWLSRQQEVEGSYSKANGSYPFSMPFDLGIQSLGVYTTRACGVPAEDEGPRLGFKRLRQIYLAHKKSGALQNYQVSLTLLAIEAYYTPMEEPGKDARYGKPVNPKRNIPEADLAWIRELVAWLVAAQTSNGSFGYTSPPASMGGEAGWEDHSNAQFSLLALKAARRCGVEVPKRVFHAALSHFLAAQQKDGPSVARRVGADPDEKGTAVRARSTVKDKARGWGYQCSARGREAATGSMTTAGISSLVICRSELLGTSTLDAALDARVVQAIHDGLAWLGSNFSVTGNPMGPGRSVDSWHYYYLYGLERAGVLSGIHWMGSHDWYGEGAEYLVSRQHENGSWTASSGFVRRRGADPASAAAPGQGDFLDTCFALLFLKKATFRVEGAVATEDADDELDLSGAASADDDSFRAIFDSVLARYRKAAGPKRDALAVDFVRMGKRSLPLLIRLLEDADGTIRADAARILEKITGVTHGYAADAPIEARAAAVVAWEEWWFARRGKLVADADAGRFRE